MHARPWTDLRALVLAFTGGVLVVHALPELPNSNYWALAALPAVLAWRGRWLLVVAALGFAQTVWQAQLRLDERWPADRHGEDRWVEGVVASLPERRASSNEANLWRFVFEPSSTDVPSRIRVAWYHGKHEVRGGDCWRFELRMRTPHGSMNPGAFDYEGWLFQQGLGATATVRDAERCEAVSGYPVLRMRQWLVERIREALPNHPARGLVQALTVGDRSEFGDADWDVFRVTGTSHLVAISGLHVGIVAAFAFFLSRWCWSLWPRLCLRLPAQKAGMLGAAMLAGVYAVLAGFQPPVVRALLMLWLGLAAFWAHRYAEPSRILAVAWIAALLLDPFTVMSPGLWLSFGAVAAIFYVMTHRLRPPGPIKAAIRLQLLLSLALAPLTVLFFQGTAWIAPAVNLVAVPLFMLLAPWTLGAVMIHAISPLLGQPLIESAAWALGLFRTGLDAAAQIPVAWLAASPPDSAVLLAVIGIALLLAPRGLPTRPLAVLCLMPMFLASASPPRGGFEVTALDVGQGLAVVVRTANHTLLYDAGPAWPGGFDAGDSVVVPHLLRTGSPRLDLFLQSHGDNDHAGGAEAVRQALDVQAQIGTVGAAICEDGMRWDWDGVRFEVLHPDAGIYSDNSASCVLRIAGPFSVLLAGDIEADAESRLLRTHAKKLRADLLIAPHHGSKTSSTEDFVAAVKPKVVVFSAGWRHHFRHPRPEVIQRYEALDSMGFTTGASGAIRAWKGGAGIEVEEYRREARRFWNATAVP